MKGRKPTKEEKEYMDRVVALGCCVCRLFHGVESPCEIHHIDGKTKEGAHFMTIGLCYNHHRSKKRIFECVSRHPWKNAFELRYGTEERLLIKTLGILNIEVHPFTRMSKILEVTA